MTRNHLLFLRATGAPPRAWLRTLARQGRTIASLYLTRHSPERTRGRRPMLLALRDFALGRTGTPEEMGSVAALLLSPRSSFVTGAIWAVDGGAR